MFIVLASIQNILGEKEGENLKARRIREGGRKGGVFVKRRDKSLRCWLDRCKNDVTPSTSKTHLLIIRSSLRE